MDAVKRQNLYLTTTDLEDARAQYLATMRPLLGDAETETIPVTEALHRVTAEAVYARFSSPLYNSAAMDGIAVRAADTEGASDETPLTLTSRQYLEVDTGDPIPSVYDAVIMAEALTEVPEGYRIIQAVQAWQSVRPVGEDIVTGEMVVSAHTALRPMELGVLMASGYDRIKVYKKMRVAILPTGTEIVPVNDAPRLGDIFESNSVMLAGQVAEWGATAERLPPAADDYAALKARIAELASTYDMVVVNAGTSAGREDYLPKILRELGTVVVHGVAMKPGKPVVLAHIGNTPVLGIPGYPVSAFLAMREFAGPLLAEMGHLPRRGPEKTNAVATRPMVSALRHREYVRVRLGQVGGRLVATPLARGAGAAMSLSRADGFCVIPLEREGIVPGETVEVELLRPLADLEKTIVSIGSHDLIMDILDDLLSQAGQGYRLSSTHVGSLSGLIALQKKECHIAPTHLLGAEGVYNVETIKKLFPEPMQLIRGVGRVQGLMVKPGNPLGYTGLQDLTRGRFVNRQRGAGTRLLLDARLAELGVAVEEIDGYEHEATTHMAVAAAVKDGGCDCGLGISSAAKAMGLDFIPVGEESYDFAAYPEFAESEGGQALLQLLQSEAFHRALDDLGGYTYDQAGQVEDVNPV